MSDVIPIKIDGKSYFVTAEMHAAIVNLAEEAETLTAMAYPNANYKMPVYLTAVGQKMIAVIKEYRALTGLNLKEAKKAVDKVRWDNERLLLGRYTYREAERISKPFRDAGATVTPIPSPLEMLAAQAE